MQADFYHPILPAYCLLQWVNCRNSAVPPVYYAHLMAKRGRLYMEATASETGDEGHAPSPSEESTSVVARCLPAVKDNVKRGMFYC